MVVDIIPTLLKNTTRVEYLGTRTNAINCSELQAESD